MLRLLRDSDRENVFDYLEQHHLETTFLIGNVSVFGLNNRTDQQRCGDYYGYFDSHGRLSGVLPFYNLGSCIPHYCDPEAVEPFAGLLRKRRFEFLLGMKQCVMPLYEAVQGKKETAKYQESGYYVNDGFAPSSAPECEFVDAREVDLDTAVSYSGSANRLGFGNVYDRERLEAMIRQRAPEEDYLFMRVGGRIVAQANVQTATSRINQIGAVYTTESERGKGYCKALVSELCRRIIQRGKRPTLIVRNDNAPAVRAYTAIGFSRYDDYLLIKFRV